MDSQIRARRRPQESRRRDQESRKPNGKPCGASTPDQRVSWPMARIVKSWWECALTPPRSNSGNRGFNQLGPLPWSVVRLSFGNSGFTLLESGRAASLVVTRRSLR
ncbi:GL15314 [Drosophila persimilis]|uniref:GL15314 n=1 Tax=Drosophila persimilis TaxID=7234 RepID=B4H9C8_DROPE|nr:GL15314 [Drosophila persimilis]